MYAIRSYYALMPLKKLKRRAYTLKQWMLPPFMGNMPVNEPQARHMPTLDCCAGSFCQQVIPEIETKAGFIQIHPCPNQALFLFDKGAPIGADPAARTTKKDQCIKIGEIGSALSPHLHHPQRETFLPGNPPNHRPGLLPICML